MALNPSLADQHHLFTLQPLCLNLLEVLSVSGDIYSVLCHLDNGNMVIS